MQADFICMLLVKTLFYYLDEIRISNPDKLTLVKAHLAIQKKIDYQNLKLSFFQLPTFGQIGLLV